MEDEFFFLTNLGDKIIVRLNNCKIVELDPRITD